MSTEKGTIEKEKLILNIDLMRELLNELPNEISPITIYSIINDCYGIKEKKNINMNTYANELAKRSQEMKETNNPFLPFFDITLAIIILNLNIKIKKKINEGDGNKYIDNDGFKWTIDKIKESDKNLNELISKSMKNLSKDEEKELIKKM